MPGYSGTPLGKKLGIKAGYRVALVAAPAGFEESLEGIGEGAILKRDPRGKAEFDVVVLFVKRRADLEKRWDGLVARLEMSGGLWVAWPKKASGVATDLTGDVVREFGLTGGLVDVKVCAIDEVWSGLRFVRRKENRKR